MNSTNSNKTIETLTKAMPLTKLRYFTSVLSVILMISSLAVISVKGFNWGLDFTGGVVTEVRLDSLVTSHEIQTLLSGTSEQDVSVISANEPGRWVLRYSLPASDENVGNNAIDIAAVLLPLDSNIEVLNSSIVGPQVGLELAEQGGLALLVSVLCIMAYLSYRFEWRLASGSLLALLHDVLLVLAFFSLTQMEFNLTVLAAVMAVLGYSLNDSIVIADRIRELLTIKTNWTTTQVNDEAVRATFARTMVTSGTTLLTISALWFMGGPPLESFSIAMFIGIITGTWSSISIGTCLPELLGLNSEHYKLVPIDDTP
ncbi:protein-export membrane protein SecF [Shewanella hanedai]|uniref:Protein-export membrane protein SecF n=1 Tax=Shewanella hanedai TaxID=25 RepID=A0A553JP46_SHEHA|nr:protein translocase subunit SecF [Shewanella hanedai]TRY14238.1 protein translocase subunit SecF [Shewanella hanedai]GGI82880.1 protein-export membrane protein SecF [Shewanella hanedai]